MQTLRAMGGGGQPNEGKSIIGPALAHTTIGIAVADLNGDFVEANDAFLKLVGRTWDELKAETVRSVTCEDDWAANQKALQSLRTGKRADVQMEKRYCQPDGTTIWVRNSLSLLRDAEGKPLYTLTFSENIQEHRKAIAENEIANETLAIATEAGGVGIWDVDMISGAMNYSTICRNIFGFPHDAPLTLDDFYKGLHPDEHDRLREIISRVADPAIRDLYDTQYRLIRPDGEVRWGHATGRAYFEGTGKDARCVRFVGAIRDVTDERRSLDALVQAEKLAATGRLAASIAHEINNPLEAVSNLLYLLRDADEDSRSAYLSLAEAEVRRITEIATQTLRFYRDPSGPTTCEISTIIRGVLTLFQGRMNLLNAKAELRLEEPLRVHGSQGELRQVFVNLIGNALDAMPNGGRLAVRGWNATGPDGRPGVRIMIADAGEGMPPEVAAKIFQAFFTTKQATGTGLGLWLTLEILQKHGGTIRVRSKAGHGTAMAVFLPSEPLPQPSPQKAS